MMYLVDLDDTPGYTLTIVQEEPDNKVEEEEEDGVEVLKEEEAKQKMDIGETASTAEQIIANARAQLDALEGRRSTVLKSNAMSAAGGLLVAGCVTTGGAVTEYSQERNDVEEANDNGKDVEVVLSGDTYIDDAAEDGGVEHA